MLRQLLKIFNQTASRQRKECNFHQRAHEELNRSTKLIFDRLSCVSPSSTFFVAPDSLDS